ncbi:hypothetical protein L1887_14626 [Cichorium endivia]|nr:hypothetical protein L1887_14626 [Cichorium endivia]
MKLPLRQFHMYNLPPKAPENKKMNLLKLKSQFWFQKERRDGGDVIEIPALAGRVDGQDFETAYRDDVVLVELTVEILKRLIETMKMMVGGGVDGDGGRLGFF